MPDPREIRVPFHLPLPQSKIESGDFRLKYSPPNEQEVELDPKDLSVPEPVQSSSSTEQIEQTSVENASAEKDSTQPKVNGLGKLALPQEISAGKSKQIVEA